jgi:hypothetical protein
MIGPYRSVHSSIALRAFALVLSVWLWALPQVMYSKVIIDLFREQGTCPLPIIEEEEVKHAISVNRASTASTHPELLVQGLVRGEITVRPFTVLHGEVPVPPPWWGCAGA